MFSLLWPSIVDVETAKKASLQGVSVAIFSVAVWTLLILYNLTTGSQFLGVDVWGFLDVFLMALIAWAIYYKKIGLPLYLDCLCTLPAWP